MACPAPAQQWLALHLPWLPLEALAATLPPQQRSEPLALFEAHRVALVNAAAAARGVAPGHNRATALALVPALWCGQADVARELQALQSVAHVALRFTPMVALVVQARPTVLLEVQASLRYFGGLTALLQRLLAELQPLGWLMREATAPTAEGALLLACSGRHGGIGAHSSSLAELRRLLDTLPAALLAPAQAQALHAMGLRSVAELRAQPRDGLTRRFGELLLARLDQARGHRPDVRQPYVPAPVFESNLELYTRADHAEQLMHGAALLLERLVAWARAQQARVARFVLLLRHEQRHRGQAVPEATELPIALAQPSDDAAHLQGLLRERLQRLQLAAPTLALSLHCHELVRTPAPNGELFPSRATQHEGLARLIERLQARLGPQQVCRLDLAEDHRPERATRLVPIEPARWPPVQTLQPPALPEDPDEPFPCGRPLWLLHPPQPLREQDLHPWLGGQELLLLAGPERIETGWWDEAPALRDYYVAATPEGALLWIYRDRRTAPAPTSGSRWWLQGRYG